MNQSMEVSELLKPRYKVIAGYPHMAQDEHGVGDIISPYGMGFLFPDKMQEMYESYPHLFKKLEWWEDREVSEMPEYVKRVEDYGGVLEGDPDVLKVKLHFRVNDYDSLRGHDKGTFISENGISDSYSYTGLLPATQSDYDQYLKSLTKLK